jgi:hypothetical protein
MILKYKDFKALTRAEMKDLRGGSSATGTCGNVLTIPSLDGSTPERCVLGGLTKGQAIQQSALYNEGGGVFNAGGYGGQVTDVNWCCASCSNFPPCENLDA